MKVLFILITFCFTCDSYAQLETKPHGLFGVGKTIKTETPSGGYFRSDSDTNLIIYISGNWDVYIMMNRNYDTILTGHLGGRIFTDYFKKFGEWKEYFPSGKLKIEGYYDFDQPIGLWKFYYPSGKLKSWYNISKITADSSVCYCKTGYFEDYYENGKVKMSGFYKVSLDTMVEAMLVPVDDNGNVKVILARGYRSVPDMTWIYYKMNGEIEKKVEH